MCQVTLGKPSRNSKHLWSLLGPKVEAMHMGYGVEGVKLTASWIELIPHTQTHALETKSSQNTVDELLDTLANRLGQERVLGVQAHESHMPEKVRVMSPAQEQTHCQAVLVEGERPSLLFDAPEPAQAVALQPDYPPARLLWRQVEHRLISSSRPERIITEWWRDGKASTRDYFKVQTDQGQWLWIYRELETARWFVHGIW